MDNIAFAQNGQTRMTTTRAYDNLSRLTAVQSGAGGSPVSSFAYQYNAANQRTRRTEADSSYWVYTYDTLGQVTAGKRHWSDDAVVAGQQFEYAFDDIGNRTSTKAGGDDAGTSLRLASYSANSLNQYTSRTVPGAVDVLGSAHADATITVNGDSVYRRGQYFWKELGVDNAAAPVWQGVTNVAELNDNGTTRTGSVTGAIFLPRTPETFTFDFDGNLLRNGRWTNKWDGENRLIEMAALAAVPDGAKRKLFFTYDHQGRRVRKVVHTWNSSTNNYQLTTDLRSLYDGWNLVAEVDGTNGLVRSYVWGTDVSGSQQGAGGVGGLLSMTVHQGPLAGTYLYSYDGNGNVAALVNATDGSVAASYEYGPFGELIRATGPLAFVNPFRFSTKYQDDETGLLYYGYRYYDPSTGRWLSRDPIGERGGLNRYVLVGDDPINDFDVLGLASPSTKNHAIVTRTLMWLVGETDQWEVLQLGGWKTTVQKLLPIVPMINSVVIDPAKIGRSSAAQYITGDRIMYLNGNNPDADDVAHETVHAYNDIRGTGFTGQRDDEGMAYATEAVYHLLKAAISVEQVLKSARSCEEKKHLATKRWTDVWRNRNAPSAFPIQWKTLGVTRNGTLDATDFSRVRSVLGAHIDCKEIANKLTMLAGSSGCCFSFGCLAVADPLIYQQIPAGISIDSSFR
jgi:RHS repeat-associated protein